MTLVSTAVRVPVILLAIAGVAGQLAYLDARWWQALDLTATAAQTVAGPQVLILVSRAVVALLCAVLAVQLVLSERQYQKASQALGVAFGAWSYLQAYGGVVLLFRPPVPGLAREAFEAHFLVVEVLALMGLVRFSALFPRELNQEELQPLPTLPPPLLPLHHLAVWMRQRWAPAVAGASFLALSWGIVLFSGGALSDAGLSPITNVFRFVGTGLVVMNLRRAWTASTEGDRDGMTWLFVALAWLLGSLSLLIGGNVLVAVTGWPEPTAPWRVVLLDVGQVGFFASLALSVLHRHAWDPGQIIQRIVSVSALLCAALFLGAGLEALLGGGIVPGVALRRGFGTALSFAIIMSMWSTLERRIRKVLPV